MKLFKKVMLKPQKKTDQSIAKIFLSELRASHFLKGDKTDKCLLYEDKDVFKMVTDRNVSELRNVARQNKNMLFIKDIRGKSLLHLSTCHPDTEVLMLLLLQGLDINNKDNEGNTCLHDAVENNNGGCVSYLLERGAHVGVLNDKQQAPIHLAADLNREDGMKKLLEHPGIDTDVPGELGSTPLHLAAWKDSAECAILLLEKNASLWKANNIGYFPLHLAAQCSSTKTLTIFIKHIEKWEAKKMKDLMSKLDNENNTVLHSAVVGGNIEVVKTILDSGMEMNVKQADGHTAVHTAASLGNVAMLKQMFLSRPEEKKTCLNELNNAGHTPLMEAAMLDRAATVDFLISEGADINFKSHNGFTAILIAASRKAWKCVSILLGQGSDPKVKDSEGRNILHLIILGGGQPCGFDFCIRRDLMAKMLNEMDHHGCTPLHYASENGLISTIDQLIKMGARVNAKSNKQQSALHFASKYGRINTCAHLLNTCAGINVINEADCQGQTALHLAAEEGHDKIVSLLLKQGAGIFRDMNGNTPLHLAAKNGYTHAMKAILSIHMYLLDLTNKNKDTCLHLAVIENQPATVNLLLNLGANMAKNEDNLYPLELGISKKINDACVAIVNHSRWKEAMSQKSHLYGCPMVGMIENMPELSQMVLDRCRTKSQHDPKEKDFHYLYDFSFLEVPHDVLKIYKKKGVTLNPLFTLNVMVKFNRVECLYHPVCVAYLNNKWLSYGLWVHLVMLAVYGVFLLCLNLFVINFDFFRYQEITEKMLNYSNNSRPFFVNHDYMKEMPTSQKFILCFITTFAFLNMVKEFFQMKQQKRQYFKDPDNILEWVFYVSLLVLALPFFFDSAFTIQWQSGAVAVFLAWFNLLVHLQRFERFGIYVVMFLEILRTLITVIMVFMVLILAFGFSFYISLQDGNSASFKTPGLAIMTSAVMMLGSIDYQQIWVDADSKNLLPNKTLNYMLLAFFILIMPILLINFLIGLAVGDIEAVLKNAKFKRIAMQVQLHTQMEQKLPLWILKFVDQPFIKIYPNASCSSFMSRMRNASIQIDASDFEDSNEMRSNVEHHSYIYKELYQQKMRTKQILKEMNKQYELLKLMVSKMEISTEHDGYDESSKKENDFLKLESPIGWSSCALKQAVLKQAFMNKSL